jgi:hypothetical protein
MKPMPPTPGRGGLAPRGILKTPLKATPHKAQERGGMGSPALTPLKAAPCQLTPLRRSYDRKVLTVLNYLFNTDLSSVPDPLHFDTDTDPWIRTRYSRLRIRILLFLAVAFKMPTENE